MDWLNQNMDLIAGGAAFVGTFFLVLVVAWPRKTSINIINEPPRPTTAESAKRASETIKAMRQKID